MGSKAVVWSYQTTKNKHLTWENLDKAKKVNSQENTKSKSVRSDFHTTDSLEIVFHAFASCESMSVNLKVPGLKFKMIHKQIKQLK